MTALAGGRIVAPVRSHRAAGHRAKQAPGLEVSGSHRPISNRGSGSAVQQVDASDAGAELRRSASGRGAGFGPAVRIVSPRPWAGRAHRAGLAPRSRPARAGRLLGATCRFRPGRADVPTLTARCATLTGGSTKPLPRGSEVGVGRRTSLTAGRFADGPPADRRTPRIPTAGRSPRRGRRPDAGPRPRGLWRQEAQRRGLDRRQGRRRDRCDRGRRRRERSGRRREAGPRRHASTYGVAAETSGGFCLPEAQLAISGEVVVRAIYDTLTIPNSKGEYVPYLAESVDPQRRLHRVDDQGPRRA